MQQSILHYLAEIVAAQGNKVFPTRPEKLKSSVLKKGSAKGWIEEVYQNLGGTDNCWNVSFSLPDGIETDVVRLSIDGPLQFNRYRSLTLNAPLYEEYKPEWLVNYRRYCRTLERECLKDGSRSGVWTNPEAEKHFGPPQVSGDFFNNGAPGWCLNAFREFLADINLFQNSQRHKRISEFERLMVQGKLLPLQQLLLSRTESSQGYLVKYLGRQLEL